MDVRTRTDREGSLFQINILGNLLCTLKVAATLRPGLNETWLQLYAQWTYVWSRIVVLR